MTGVRPSFDSQTLAEAGDRPAPRRLSVCASARGSLAVPSELEERWERAGAARGRALERPSRGPRSGRDFPGPIPKQSFGVLELEAVEAHLAGVCQAFLQFMDSGFIPPKRLPPGLGTPAQGRSRPWFNLLDPTWVPFQGNAHPRQLGCWLTLSRQCLKFLRIDHPK